MKKILVLITLICMTLVGSIAHAETLYSAADTWVRDGSGDNYGDDPEMYLLGGVGRCGYIRFDLSALGAVEIQDATLTLTKVTAPWGRSDTMVNGRVGIVGLDNIAGNTAQDWDELVLTASNVGDEFVGGSVPANPIDLTKATDLDMDRGADVTENVAGGVTFTLTGNDLVGFLQERVYDGGLVTLIATLTDSTTKGFWIGSKEHATEASRPVLELTYTRLTHAYNPNPGDSSTVPLAEVSKLSWMNPDPNNPNDIITSTVYFGDTEPNLNNPAPYGLTQYDTGITATEVNVPVTPVPSTTYWWVVDCTDPNTGGSSVPLPGLPWSFYVSGAPIIVTDPVDTAKFETETADFSATFTTDAAITSGWPKWYKVGEPDTEMLASDPDVTISLDTPDGVTFTSTLSIANLEVADEGSYYCEIKNANATTQTASAKLIVKRLLAHWPFDSDPNDLQGNYDGVASGAPVYDAGKVSNAIVFDGADDFITLPSGFDDFTAGMTVAVWAKPSAVTNWARFIDFGNGAGTNGDNILFTRIGTDDTNTLRFDTGNGVVDAAGALELDVWQMFVATMDDAGNVVIYKDGLPLDNGTGTVDLPNVATRTSNFIGESNWAADDLYAGMMDDMRIYNYALTADNVADLYSDVVGDYCRYPENVPYDLTGDCLVNMDDLVYFVGNWLDCGFYPDNAGQCQ